LANLKEQGESEDSREVEKSNASSNQVESDSGGSRPGKGGDQWVPNAEKPHPSRKLELRSRGYGIAAGYERPYKRARGEQQKSKDESYGPIPHSGYYGAGEALRPFKVGQAGFDKELEWYRNQYGKETSGYAKKK
jgi:hypothetical protein